MLIIANTSHQIEASNLGSWANNKKYGEKNEGETCRLNLYPIVSHGSPNFEYGPCENHISTNLISLFTLFI